MYLIVKCHNIKEQLTTGRVQVKLIKSFECEGKKSMDEMMCVTQHAVYRTCMIIVTVSYRQTIIRNGFINWIVMLRVGGGRDTHTHTCDYMSIILLCSGYVLNQ